MQSQFNLQDSIEQATARQARRSMRSFSVSSCSSMSSLLSSCPSIGSMSSLTSLSSSTDGFQKDAVHNGGVAGLACSSAVRLGKRRRKQNPKKEAERRGRRQGANPRKRKGSKRERIDEGKRRKASSQAVHSSLCHTTLFPVKNADPEPKAKQKLKAKPMQKVYNLEEVKLQGIEVVSWEGM